MQNGQSSWSPGPVGLPPPWMQASRCGVHRRPNASGTPAPGSAASPGCVSAGISGLGGAGGAASADVCGSGGGTDCTFPMVSAPGEEHARASGAGAAGVRCTVAATSDVKLPPDATWRAATPPGEREHGNTETPETHDEL